jgi:signal transduction histidine kinase
VKTRGASLANVVRASVLRWGSVQETNGAAAVLEEDPAQVYARVLSEYFTTRGEDALYHASLLSQTFIENGLGPEEIVALHAEAVEEATRSLSYRERARAATDGLQFLLEVMIAYGVQYRRYLDLRLSERDRVAEAESELARQRASDAEHATREKTEFLAVVAHELRTPLTVAKGNVDLAINQADRQRWDRLPRALGSARDAIQRLVRLSDELVEVSRGEVRPLKLIPIDVSAVTMQACEWAQIDAGRKGVDLTWRSSPEGLMVLGDRDALLMVFGNLLSNAVRYTDPGGRIELRTISADAAYLIEVIDTGIGMTPEIVEHIFDDFFRAEEARSYDANGLGLGLALAHRLVVAHGGRMEVESEHGSGSTFRVILPADPGPASEEQR